MADLLDLDGEVLHAYLSQAIAWVHQVAAGRPVQRILDVGSGTGNGALALAERFPGAEVIAVDDPVTCWPGCGPRPATAGWTTGCRPSRPTWTRPGRPSARWT